MSSSNTKNRYCSSFGCLNSSINPELSFFSIPIDKDRRIQWLRLIDREDLLNMTKGPRVCEVHFDVNDIIIKRNRKLLKKGSLPRRHLPTVCAQVKEAQTDITIPSTSNEMRVIIKSDNITQTTVALCEDIPRVKQLKSELSTYKKRLRLASIQNTTTKAQQDMFYKLCDRFLSKNLAKVVKIQTHINSSKKGNRYSLTYKRLCSKLYNASPQLYGLLQETICLPCKTTLMKLHLPISTEVNNQIMTKLKLKVNNMSDKKKQCTLILDSMSLQANLFYDIKNDKIIGFQEIDGVQSSSPAKHALVVLVRGIFVPWSQAVGYALLSECKSADNISNWINKIILNLFEIGLKIRVIVSDLRSDFLNVTKEISVDKTYLNIAGQKIYYIFDVPHLIKLLRNNLMIYDFYYNNYAIAKFDHILQFYELEQKRTFKQACKLTNSHINPTNSEKKKVRYATQLLSRSVASGLSTYIDFKMIKDYARKTVEFIKMMNDLFDALNSSTFHHSYSHKSAFCGNQEQIDFFKNALILFRSLKLYNPKNGNEVTESVKFINPFQVTIQAVLDLYEDLKQEGYQYILTRRLNRDIIEKLFVKIRAKKRNIGKPTSKQFTSAFCRVTQVPKSDNCAEVFMEILEHLKDLESEKTASDTDNTVVCNDENNIFGEIVGSDYKKLDLPEINTLFYICGVLLKKCVDRHNDCEILKMYLEADQQARNLNAEARSQHHKDFTNKNLLLVPPDDFVAYINRIEQVFYEVFEQTHIISNIGTTIYEQIQDIKFPLPCPCFPKTYLHKLYIRIRIYFTISTNNKAFQTSQNREICFSVPNLFC